MTALSTRDTALVPLAWINREDIGLRRKLDGILVRYDKRTGLYRIYGRNDKDRRRTRAKQGYYRQVYEEYALYRRQRSKVPAPLELLYGTDLSDGEKVALLILYAFRTPNPEGKGFVDSGWIAPALFRRRLYGPNWKQGTRYRTVVASLVEKGILTVTPSKVGRRRWDWRLLEGWKGVLMTQQRSAAVLPKGPQRYYSDIRSGTTEIRNGTTRPFRVSETEAGPPGSGKNGQESVEHGKTPSLREGGLPRLGFTCVRCWQSFPRPTLHDCRAQARGRAAGGRP